MAGIFPLLALLLAGVLLQYKFAGLKETLLPWLNRWILWIAIPALTVLYLSRLNLSPELLIPISVAWLLFGLAALWVRLLQPWLGLRRPATGCLILLAGLGNTSFVGFPLIRLLYGENGLQTAVLVDQPGSFLVLGTLGLVTAAAHAGEKATASQLLKRVLGFPPFLAFIAALICQLLHWRPSGILESSLSLSGQTLGPLALFSVGLQLSFEPDKSLLRPVMAGLGFKLLLAPMLIAGIYAGLFGLRGEMIEVCILEAGMGPMITAAIVANSYQLQPKLASLMLGIGIPLSLATVLGLHALIRLL